MKAVDAPDITVTQEKDLPMTDNSFGHLFRFTTWGESHGPSIGCVLDGVLPGLRLMPPTFKAGWTRENQDLPALSLNAKNQMKSR